MQSAPPKTPSNPFAPRSYGHIEKVTERVYLYRNITNSTILVGDQAAAIVDTQVNMPTARRVLECARQITSKPIRWVVNTHYHWDHTNGNALFGREGAKIVSSRLTKEFMTVRAPRQKEFLAGRGFELGEDPLLPDTLFDGETAFDLGNLPVRVFFAGKAETDDASAVFLPTEGVVLAGDTVMTGSFPIFGQPVWDEGLQGDGNWQATIARLLALEPRHIVPGHGPLAHQPEVDLLLKIENYFQEEVSRCIRRGLGPLETLSDLERRLPDWVTRIPIVWGNPRYAILRVYRGLTRKPTDPEPGWQRFKPSAVDEFIRLADEAKEGGDAGLRLSVLRKAAEANPNSCPALCAWADALIEASRAEDSVLEKGDFFDAARRAWDRALSLDPEYAGALLGKGRYLTMMAFRGGEDPAAGMALLERARSSKPGGRMLAETEFYLGIGHRRLGNEAAARRQFQKALASDPAFMPAALAASAVL